MQSICEKMIKKRNFVWVFFILFFVSESALSQEPSEKTKADVSLSTGSIIERVLSVSRAGKIARLNAAIANAEATKARAPYDQVLMLDADHRIDASDRAITVFGTRNDTTNLNARYQTIFPTGTRLEAGFFNLRQTSNSPFATLNPAHEAAWYVGLSQPLLRNAFGKDLRTGIKIAEANSASVSAQSRRQVESVLQAALTQYWTWLAFVADEEVARQAHARAEEFLKITNRKAKLGVAEDPDVFAAKANLANRQEELLAVADRIRQSELALKNILLYEASTLLKSEELLKGGVHKSESVDAYLKRAQENRADLAASKKRLEASQLQVEAASVAALPQFDLTTTLRMNEVDSGWGSAAGGSFSTDNPNWFIGGQLTIPLENREREAEKQIAILENRRVGFEFEQLQDDIQTQIQQAWDSLDASIERTKKAEEAVRLESKKLAAKLTDFRRGRADALTIVIYQQDLLNAERKLLSLQAEKKISEVELAFATGTLIPGGANLKAGELNEGPISED